MEKPNDFLSQIPSVTDVKERIRRHGEERKILRKLLNLAEEADRVRGECSEVTPCPDG